MPRRTVEQVQDLLKGTLEGKHFLVYLDEAPIHQDTDLDYGWSVRGEWLWVCSNSPRLSAKVSSYGLYLYNREQTEIWPYPRDDGDYTVEVLTRLRQRLPSQLLNCSGMGRPIIVRGKCASMPHACI